MRATLFLCILTITISACSAPPRFGSWELPDATQFTENTNHFVIQNTQCNKFETGIVFYPGGLVSAGAYIPLMARLAKNCHFVVLAKMPLGLAVLNPSVGKTLKTQYLSQSETWTLGGHSLGGAMAAGQIETFDGLFLLAAYITSDNGLRASGKPVLSVSASKDGLATPAKINANKKFLPQQATFVEIIGGNHAQFGDYGPQDKDLPADISLEKQQEQIALAIQNWLKANVKAPAN